MVLLPNNGNILMAAQQADGHFVFELEADCTIPAEYILMLHYLGESDRLLEARLAHHLREQNWTAI